MQAQRLHGHCLPVHVPAAPLTASSVERPDEKALLRISVCYGILGIQHLAQPCSVWSVRLSAHTELSSRELSVQCMARKNKSLTEGDTEANKGSS